ncbi:MAG: NADH:ubiquinone oxidoreductase, partial [Pseudomonas sp.]
QVANMPYRQDIHYYGVATDAAYLQPYCEAQSQGTWLKP